MRLGLLALGLVFVYGAFQLGRAADLVLYCIAKLFRFRLYDNPTFLWGQAVLYITTRQPPETPPSTFVADTDLNLLKLQTSWVMPAAYIRAGPQTLTIEA